MNSEFKQTVVIFSGLPYSGKTAIIHHLSDRLPGKAVYVDSIFRDIVPENEVCLQRWLEEGPRLVEGIIQQIAVAAETHIYVEVGIMQAIHRGRLMQWIQDHNYRLVPILLQCRSTSAVRRRQQARARDLAAQPEKLKIAIDLDELYGPISDAFDEIRDEEGYHVIDTDGPIEKSVKEISRLLDLE